MRRPSLFHRLRERLAELGRDERGHIFVHFTIMAAVMVGMAGLSIDVGRFVTTNSQAKAAADAAALAAATVMASAVRAPGADPDDPQPVIDAMWTAARTGVSNDQQFATVSAGDGATSTGGQVDIVRIRLLTGLPELDGGADTDPVDAYVTGDPWSAHFVEVTTEVLTQNNAFMAAVGGGATASSSAVAIAGFKQVMCQVPPMWICNPAEENGAGSVLVPEDYYGRQIRMRAANPGSAWSPGNFGLLDGLWGQSVRDITQVMATAAPNACFQSDGADLRPGRANPTVDGLNTRFDIYQSPHVDNRDPQYRPALNVAKGFEFDTPACSANQTTPTPERQMPRDSNLVADPAARMGDGNWNCADYWDANHPDTVGDPRPTGCAAVSKITRYDLYRHEIDTPTLPPGGAPQCYAGPTPIQPDPDRRIVYFAMVNCLQHELNGNRDDVPIAAFGKGFLTEPVAEPPLDEVYMEFLDVVRPGDDDGVLHEIVQLYR